MTMKKYIVGRETRTMLTQASQWTTIAEGGMGLRFENATFNWDQSTAPLKLSGSYWQNQIEQGTIAASLQIVQPFMLNDLRALALCLGAEDYSAPVEQTAGQGDYLHQIAPSTHIDGLFATIASQRAADQFTIFPSCAFSGFQISGQVEPNHLKLELDALADTVSTDGASLDTAAFESLQYPYDQRAYFRNCRFYMNDHDDAALSSAAEITSLISSFSFSFKRSLSSDYTNTSGLSIEQPLEDGAPEITLQLGLVQKDAAAAALFDDYRAGTVKKISIEAVAGPANPQASGQVENARLTIDVPAAVVTSNSYPDFNSMERQTADVTFSALAPASQPNGMAFDQPFRITVINNQSTRAVTPPQEL